jgi:uncharacterized protein involved in exopolysaccharide biosynthesis
MKLVLRVLIRLYPAWWRRRYGKELEALLEDSGSGSRDVWDLIRGAMEMQIKTWPFGRIVTVSGIAGVVLAGVVAFSMPYRYRSTAVLKISQSDSDAVKRVVVAAFTSQALTDIIRREHLYADAPAEETIDRMRRAILVRRAAQNLAQVSFAYEDAVQAQRVSQELVGRIIAANLNPTANPNGLTIQLVVPADQPQKQFEGKRYGLAGLGLPAGLLFGVVLALILRRRAPAAN